MDPSPRTYVAQPPARELMLAVSVVLLVTAVRAVVLAFSDLNLYGDEAQYWSWAQAPAFGYFSKPPMVAWVIWVTTAVCGDGEFCVRVPSTLIHAATGLVIFLLARELYDARVALWSAVAYVTLPAVSLSSAIISTDVPLLFFWSLALLFFHRAMETKRAGWALATGLAVGLGLLSKYAMAYFVLCAVLYCLSARHARWFLTGRHAALALGAAAIVIAPNVVWNLEHGWATYSHTVANAHWVAPFVHFDKALEFLASQFAFFGPILFGALLVIVVAWRPRRVSRPDHLLLAFSVPVIALVVGQSLLSRANANWAAPAYAAATILVTAWLLRNGRVLLLRASVGLHVAAATVFYAAVVAPAGLPLPGGLDPLARVRGWDVLADEITLRLEDRPDSVVLFDDRMVMAEMLYYLRSREVSIRMWRGDRSPHNHYELTAPLEAEDSARVLFITASADPRYILERFESAQLAEALCVAAGQGRLRTFFLYDLVNLKRP